MIHDAAALEAHPLSLPVSFQTLSSPSPLTQRCIIPISTRTNNSKQWQTSTRCMPDKHKMYAVGLNEATLAARRISNIFPFADVPEPLDDERSIVPCQTLEF